MMFEKAGVYKACGIFTGGHFLLIGITAFCIYFALKNTINKSRKEIYKIIRKSTIIICTLEILKIIYCMCLESVKSVNNYLPLYYCSMLLYAGILSSFGKGKLKRTGDVFLATGAIIGGSVFMIYPSTTLPQYPAFHILSLYSFLFHGLMVYLGLLINITHYIELRKEDIKYYSVLVGTLCIVAFITNNIFDSNLMFISKNFDVFPINIIYGITNGTIFFNIIMMLGQMTVPFYVSYYGIELIEKIKDKHNLEKNYVLVKS